MCAMTLSNDGLCVLVYGLALPWLCLGILHIVGWTIELYLHFLGVITCWALVEETYHITIYV